MSEGRGDMWWGYLHANGTVQVKYWTGDHADYTTDCQGNPNVIQVVKPFVAASRDEAASVIREMLQLAAERQTGGAA